MFFQKKYRRIRFRLKFKNPDGLVAKDLTNPVEDFILEYPSGVDDWLTFQGPQLAQGTSFFQKIWTDKVAHTSEGQFSFAPTIMSAPSGSGGQTFKPGTGKQQLQTYGRTTPGPGGGDEVRQEIK